MEGWLKARILVAGVNGGFFSNGTECLKPLTYVIMFSNMTVGRSY